MPESTNQKYFTFRFRRQPLKLFYTLYKLITIPCFKLPFYILRAAFVRPQPSWSIARTVYVDVFREIVTFLGDTGIAPPPSPEKGARSARKHGVGFDWVEPLPQDMIVGDVREAAQVNGISAEKRWGYWYGPGVLEEGFKRPAPGTKMFYFVHGGGFVLGSAHTTDLLTPVTATHLLKHCTGANMFAIEYRLSTAEPFPLTNGFPAAVIDALSGYHHLIHTLKVDPQDIIVSGSSAGGDIATAMALYIIRHNLQSTLPLPRALWLESPAVDWGMSHVTPTSSMTTNARSDFIGTFIQPTDYCVRAVLGKLPKEEAEANIYISSASKNVKDSKGLFENFPDVALLYGSSEILVDVIHTLRDRLVQDLGKEKVLDIEEPDCPHVFSGMHLHDKAKQNAFSKLGRWYKDL
ncbi:alpha/beta-hydrolase [Dendrothele bispora CBS 962.96]|uniref:Alpha/beta-hydrolase n=1 Tax=Dendrothele bispora (strain CBS 962.96) TaxID=1314807 RepID=A0A4S8MJ31_DENBC|nr:alpha/beta-hydrolase [Dendrothele bispora CBS 962.96]